MQTIDIKKFTVTELKAFKCDVFEEINRLNANLQAVNNELSLRDLVQEVPKEKLEEVLKVESHE